MQLRVGNPLVLTMVAFFSCSALGQLTVDATGPHKAPDFGISGGSGGGVGRNLTLQVTVKIDGIPYSAGDGRTVVDFTLTNSGKENIFVPVSPDPEDVGSATSFRELSLSITAETKYKLAGKDRKLLQAETESHNQFINLYGVQGTLFALAPGQSMHVLGEVALPHVSEANQQSGVFVAHVMLDDNYIKTVSNKRLMDSREVGIATSREYKAQDLFEAFK